MRVAILTAPRERTGYEYLIRTFQSVVGTAQLPHEYHVFVDAYHLDDETCNRLEFNGIHPTIHLQPPNVPLLFRDRPLHFWGTPNFVRALQFACEAEASFGCVFEDDVEHTRGWDAKAIQLCDMASTLYDDQFIFSLHHFYDVDCDFYFGPTLPSYSGLAYQMLRFKDSDLFYGGQGLMVPREFGQKMATAYEDKWDLPAEEFSSTWAMDLGVKNMAKQLDAPILSCNPCLIQHTGLLDSVLRSAVADKDNWYRPDLVNRYFNADPHP